MHINAINALGLGFGGQNMNLLLQKLKLQRLQKLQLTQAFRGFPGLASLVHGVQSVSTFAELTISTCFR